jgi:hypothetical protein
LNPKVQNQENLGENLQESQSRIRNPCQQLG